MKTTIALANRYVKCSFSKVEADLLVGRKFQRVVHYTVILKLSEKRFSLIHFYKDLAGNWITTSLEELRNELFTTVKTEIDAIESKEEQS